MPTGFTLRHAIRPVQLLLGLALATAGVLAWAAGPAAAAGSGVVSTFTTQPAATAAGGDPTVTSQIAFDYGTGSSDSVRNMTVTLPPGLFANPTAVPEMCTPAELGDPTGNPPVVPNCPAGSEVGTGTVTSNIGQSTVALYLMPAPASPSNAVAGLGMVISVFGVQAIASTGVVEVAIVGGQPVLQMVFTDLPNHYYAIPLQVDAITLNIDGTAPAAGGGPSSTPFIRLPTACTPATTTLNVDTYAAAGSGGGTDTFTPTDCASLPYAPVLSATATKNGTDNGVQLVTSVTHQPGEAADATIELALPAATLQPDIGAAVSLIGSPGAIGSAAATTPLLPAPLRGRVFLTGTLAAPMMTVTFPPPFAVSFSGAISLANSSVTFTGVPDIPLTNFTVTIGGGSNSLFMTNCTTPTGAVTGTFGGQNGAAPPPQKVSLTVAGCGPGGGSTGGNGTPNGGGTGTANGSGTMAVSVAGTRLTVRIGCRTAPTGGRCRGTVTVTSSTGTALGSGAYSVLAGHSQTISLQLNGAGRRLLGRSFRLPATVALTGSLALSDRVVFRYTRVRSQIDARWGRDSRGAFVKVLEVFGLPWRATVTVRCAGGGCPFARRTLRRRGNAMDLTRLLHGSRLAPGATVEVRVTAPGQVGEVKRFRIRRRHQPVTALACVAPGTGIARACP
jgi:hypothetical protein